MRVWGAVAFGSGAAGFISAASFFYAFLLHENYPCDKMVIP